MRVHSHHANAYPEVTGYLVPTLLDYGERDLAARLLRWLLCVQRKSGAYADPDAGMPYAFDTGQVLRGLTAGFGLVDGAEDAAKRACESLCAQMLDGGKMGFPLRYDGLVPEGIHLYALPPLLRAADLLGMDSCRAAAERCADYYCAQPDLLRTEHLTHFLAYELEALIDMGRAELALPMLRRLQEEQRNDGSVPARSGVKWVCSPGLVQLAICWYKLGQWQEADRAVAWLESHQTPSGGFLGSYGKAAGYFPNDELSWTTKFYLDAHRLRLSSLFNREAEDWRQTVASTTAYAKALPTLLHAGMRILHAGCGDGRHLQGLKGFAPDLRCAGVDLASLLPPSAPPGIELVPSTMEGMPFPDNHFDLVLSLDGLARSVNPEAEIRELVRVCRPGGEIVVLRPASLQPPGRSLPRWVGGLSRAPVPSA